jgi:hypothetical protein
MTDFQAIHDATKNELINKMPLDLVNIVNDFNRLYLDTDKPMKSLKRRVMDNLRGFIGKGYRLIKTKIKFEGNGNQYLITATCKINHYSCYNVEKYMFIFWVNREDMTLHLNSKYKNEIYPSNNLKAIYNRYYQTEEYVDNFHDVVELRQMVDIIKLADDE